MAKDLDADGDRGAGIVWAAGGAVWRRRPDPAASAGGPEVEVVLVHRPKYDDWSLPKGKLDPGEELEETALREVEEETGLRCRLGPELVSTRYRDRRGRDKVVRYWAMTVEEQDERPPDDEVDEWRWVTTAEAEGLLTYARDRSVLASLRSVVDTG